MLYHQRGNNGHLWLEVEGQSINGTPGQWPATLSQLTGYMTMTSVNWVDERGADVRIMAAGRRILCFTVPL